MRFVPTTHPAGTVGLVSASLPRFAEFHGSLEFLQAPGGTKLDWRRGCDIARSWNEIVEDLAGEWLWILGDDHVFNADLLIRLLDRQVNVVLPAVPLRMPPFFPVVYHGPYGKGSQYQWKELPIQEELFALPEGDLCGTAGLLVRKHVLKALKPPPFRVGEFALDRMNEDFSFITAIQNAGFTVHVDTMQSMGHTSTATVCPEQMPDGSWRLSLDMGTGRVGIGSIEVRERRRG